MDPYPGPPTEGSALKLIWAPVPMIIVVNVYFFRLVLGKGISPLQGLNPIGSFPEIVCLVVVMVPVFVFPLLCGFLVRRQANVMSVHTARGGW